MPPHTQRWRSEQATAEAALRPVPPPKTWAGLQPAQWAALVVGLVLVACAAGLGVAFLPRAQVPDSRSRAARSASSAATPPPAQLTAASLREVGDPVDNGDGTHNRTVAVLASYHHPASASAWPPTKVTLTAHQDGETTLSSSTTTLNGRHQATFTLQSFSPVTIVAHLAAGAKVTSAHLVLPGGGAT